MQKAELLEWKNRQLSKELWAMHKLFQELEEKLQGDSDRENKIDQILCCCNSQKDRVYLMQ